MKSFWISLLLFILFMCSCKTQKLDSNVKERTDIRSGLSIKNESVKISTQKHDYFANDTQNIVVEEVITVTEYDKVSGKGYFEWANYGKLSYYSNTFEREARANYENLDYLKTRPFFGFWEYI